MSKKNGVRRFRRRRQTTDAAHLSQLEIHAKIADIIKTQRYIQIGSFKCTTVGAALTAMEKQQGGLPWKKK